jgi:hypothetical protein
MATQGRKNETKAWETGFRHVLSTSYLKEPDLHMLLFISEGGLNEIIRDALRDYMVKHSSKALDPDYQATIFMEASRQMSRGVRPVISEVLAGLSGGAASVAQAPTQQRKREPSPASTPVPIVTRSVTESEIGETPGPVAQTQTPIAKAKVVLDFGPELDLNEVETAEEKPSQRSKWLSKHQY